MKKIAKQKTLLLGILVPIISVSVMYNLLATFTSIWGSMLAAGIVAMILLYRGTYRSLFWAVVLEYAIAAIALGALIVDSMLKGIELVSGTQTGTFLGLPVQYGLWNTKDGIIALILFALVIVVNTYLLQQRQQLKATENIVPEENTQTTKEPVEK